MAEYMVSLVFSGSDYTEDVSAKSARQAALKSWVKHGRPVVESISVSNYSERGVFAHCYIMKKNRLVRYYGECGCGRNEGELDG